MANDSRLAVLGAMSLLGRKPEGNAVKTTSSIPTARTRSALELLFRSSVDDLRTNQVNIREVASDLFNWNGNTNKATKTVMRALTNALNTPDKYAHAVELTSFVAAMAPMLEPDRLARLFGALDKVDTVYAPNVYTLQLSHQLAELFNRYPEQVRERLAFDLWVTAHEGRWWDLTSGVTIVDRAAEEGIEAEETRSPKQLVKDFIKGDVTWSKTIAEKFQKLPYNEDIIGFMRDYNVEYAQGKVLDPDIGLISSYIPWIPLEDRTESPISILLRELMSNLRRIEGFELPDKPKTFKSMFPDIRLIIGDGFPFTPQIMSTNGIMLMNGVRLEVVSTPAALMENRTYMGNCTWSYKHRMEKCEYVLYRIHDTRQGHDTIYNASMTIQTNRANIQSWSLGEINSRHNRGQVPTDVRQAFTEFVKAVPVPEARYRELVRDARQNGEGRKLRYKLY